MISQTAEYALRAILCLAGAEGEPVTTQAVAQRGKIPAGYLSKVLQALGRAGIVQSQRGLHGGFTLKRDPAALSVLDVVSAVDPIQRIHECPLGIASHGKHLCPLHRRLDDALCSVETALGRSTIAEILADPNPSKPLCDLPPEDQSSEDERTSRLAG
ncbi:MAG: RrF2 family transcriptional regulator [Phycisphaeraceae bacterium]